jgi:hypothetical protein
MPFVVRVRILSADPFCGACSQPLHKMPSAANGLGGLLALWSG